ncbi:hypothetical protein Lal_00042644 [Lupinus albus]|nr:hypothetical protein Lal_00042644 [Lupinus albus]
MVSHIFEKRSIHPKQVREEEQESDALAQARDFSLRRGSSRSSEDLIASTGPECHFSRPDETTLAQARPLSLKRGNSRSSENSSYQPWDPRLSRRFSLGRERFTWEGEILGYTREFSPEQELSRLGEKWHFGAVDTVRHGERGTCIKTSLVHESEREKCLKKYLVHHGKCQSSLNKSLVRHGMSENCLNKSLVDHGKRENCLNKPFVHHGKSGNCLKKSLIHHSKREKCLNKSMVHHGKRVNCLKKSLVHHGKHENCLNKSLVHHIKCGNFFKKSLVHHSKRENCLNKYLVHHSERENCLNKFLLHHGKREKCLNKSVVHHDKHGNNFSKSLVHRGKRRNCLNKSLVHHGKRGDCLKKSLVHHGSRLSEGLNVLSLRSIGTSPKRRSGRLSESEIWKSYQILDRAWILAQARGGLREKFVPGAELSSVKCEKVAKFSPKRVVLARARVLEVKKQQWRLEEMKGDVALLRSNGAYAPKVREKTIVVLEYFIRVIFSDFPQESEHVNG